jgi:hypothetical protein
VLKYLELQWLNLNPAAGAIVCVNAEPPFDMSMHLKRNMMNNVTR